jgi:hypothetical protein
MYSVTASGVNKVEEEEDDDGSLLLEPHDNVDVLTSHVEDGPDVRVPYQKKSVAADS